MNLHLFRPPRRRTSTFRPRVESLEDRRVPSCTVTFTGGNLTITGDNSRNTVVINDNGANTPTFTSGATTADTGTTLAVSVTCNGVTQNFPAPGTPTSPPPVLNTMLITMGSSNDRVTYNLPAGLRANAVRFFSVNLGAGNDTFTLNVGATVVPATTQGGSPTVLNGLGQGSVLVADVFGAAGNDSLSVHATQGFDIAANALAVLNLLGGAGNDNIAVNVNARLSGPFLSSTGAPARAGSLNVLADGRSGNDNVLGLLNLQGGNTTATINGGDGDDNLGLVANFDDTDVALEPPQFQNPTHIAAVINGGGGHNACFRTANVSANGCSPNLVI
jgi:hypothetical protein